MGGGPVYVGWSGEDVRASASWYCTSLPARHPMPRCLRLQRWRSALSTRRMWLVPLAPFHAWRVKGQATGQISASWCGRLPVACGLQSCYS